MMVAESTTLLPEMSAMLAHLEHVFGGFLDGAHDGLIEIAWTDDIPDPDGKFKLRHARYFGTDELEEAAEFAAATNAQPMRNVYFGGALRLPGGAPFGRGNDSDFYSASALWADLDSADAAANARTNYADLRPTLLVRTGRHPHNRLQPWWRLTDNITYPERLRAVLTGIAHRMAGDTTVTNPSRVMRLAGSIAWPHKPGRVAELTEIVTLKEPAALPAYMPEHVERIFPPVHSLAAARERRVEREGGDGTIVRERSALGFEGKVVDGRERYMRDLIVAHLIEHVAASGVVPTADAVFATAWPVYARTVDFSRPGRGESEFREKVRYTLRRFERGEIHGLRTLEEAVEVGRRKAQAKRACGPMEQQAGPERVPDDDGPFRASELTGEPPERRWLVPDWLPLNVVASLYGDGGVGKTLIAQQLAYAAGIGGTWLGIRVPKTTVLGVFCEDERDEIHRRHKAIKASLGFAIGNPFQDVWLWPRVGFDNLLVTFDRDHKPVVAPLFERVRRIVHEQDIGLLILDTAADLYGGNEIVRTEVNYFLKAVCGRLVREAQDQGRSLTVLILAHPSQSGKESGEGFSGNTAWNNSVRARLYLNRVEDGHPDERVLTRKKSNYSRSGDGEQINLIWDNGVLAPMSMSDEGQKQRARDRIVQLVKQAWDVGEPLVKRRSSSRNLENRIVEYLKAEGIEMGAIVEGLREAKEAKLIAVESSNGRYGWRAQ